VTIKRAPRILVARRIYYFSTFPRAWRFYRSFVFNNVIM
jgi:hypothetical protein